VVGRFLPKYVFVAACTHQKNDTAIIPGIHPSVDALMGCDFLCNFP
jgi:hypothetical protein